MSSAKEARESHSEEKIHPSDESVTTEDAVDTGAKTVEATHKVYGKYSKWALFIGLGLAAYIYSLDGQTTFNYLRFATSALGDHSLIGSIQVAQSIIIAVFKPVIAKFADVSSRGTAYIVVLVFYVIGYIVVASAKNVNTVAGGIVLYAIGYTGLQLLTQIIIADITTLKWRGLVSSLITLPFVINFAIGANISASVLKDTTNGWRWGYGMFAILIPVSLSPLIVTLLWAERKARKLGVVAAHQTSASALSLRKIVSRMDILGLLLIGASVSLILLPLTLAEDAKGHWKNPSMIAMIVVGCILLPVFGLWEFKFAKHPAIPYRFVVNRAIVASSLIGFFDFVSFYLTFTYLSSFITVVKPWSIVDVNYFSSSQTIALTVFGILGGIIMRFSRRYKYIVVVGLLIRLLGVGLMIHSRGANGTDAELVWTQILQGLGGGFAAVASQVGAQASVTHADVATATAVVLLITEIGGAIGGGIATAIWTNTMPNKLEQYLPNLSQADRDALYESIITVVSSPRGDPKREGAISAYGDVMLIMCVASTCVAIIPVAISLLLPNYYLGDTQNALDPTGLAGETASSAGSERSEPEKVHSEAEASHA